MLIEADITNDFDKRQAIYKKLHKILAVEAPYSFLWTVKHHAAHSRNISRVSIEPLALFKNITDWRIKPGSETARR